MQRLMRPVRNEEQGKKPDKPLVVLDTNILVSALLTPEGTAAQVLDLFMMNAVQVCYSSAVLSEYEEVLSRAKFKDKITPEMIKAVLGPLKENGSPYDVTVSSFPMKDESDRAFYDVAKTAGAFLVTGNKKHYPDEPFIVTPRNFIDSVIEVH